MVDYKITGSPETIWLNYGDIDRDDTHEKCARDGEVTWCDEAVFYSDIKYVRADIAQAREAELVANVERLRLILGKANLTINAGLSPQHAEWKREVSNAMNATPAQSLAAITDPLNAHIERLKRALEMPCDRWSKKQYEIVKEVLESTPAQSLARLRNEAMEKCESMICTELFDSTLRRNLIEKLRAMKEPT